MSGFPSWKLSWKFARRYLFARKSTNAINIISAIAGLGMIFGTIALILVLSVFNGFEDLVSDLYGTFNPDIRVTAQEGKFFHAEQEVITQLEQLAEVSVVSQVIEQLAFLKYDEKDHFSIIKGVDEKFVKVSQVDTAVFRGEFKLRDGPLNYAVLGWGVESSLGVDLGDPFARLQVYIPKKKASRSLDLTQAFNSDIIEPIGTFRIQEEYDRKYTFVPIEFLGDLLELKQGEISALELALNPEDYNEKTRLKIAEIMGAGFDTKNRYQQDEFSYQVMQMEKWIVYLILSFIMIVASFNIVGSLSMLVIEKSADISVLKSMGATNGMIRSIFMTEGLLLSISAGLIGMLIAFVIGMIQMKFGIIKISGHSFLLEAYPISMRIGDFLLVLLTIVAISVLASWYPAKRAARQKIGFG